MRKIPFVCLALMVCGMASGQPDPTVTAPNPVNYLPENFDYNTLVPITFAEARTLFADNDGWNTHKNKIFVTIATYRGQHTETVFNMFECACFSDFGVDGWAANGSIASEALRTFFGNIQPGQTVSLCFGVVGPIVNATAGPAENWIDGKELPITIMAIAVCNPPPINP